MTEKVISPLLINAINKDFFFTFFLLICKIQFLYLPLEEVYTKARAMKINWKYFAGSIFALLGFNGCENIGFGLAMYGQPTADYKLVGDVKGPDGKPIEGIRGILVPRENTPYDNDTLYTDSKGHFEKEVLKYHWPDDLKEAKLILEDMDGPERGSFKPKILTRSELKVVQNRQGSGSWDYGAFTVSADVTLEKDE